MSVKGAGPKEDGQPCSWYHQPYSWFVSYMHTCTLMQILILTMMYIYKLSNLHSLSLQRFTAPVSPSILMHAHTYTRKRKHWRKLSIFEQYKLYQWFITRWKRTEEQQLKVCCSYDVPLIMLPYQPEERWRIANGQSQYMDIVMVSSVNITCCRYKGYSIES